MLRADKVLMFVTLSRSVKKQVKPFVADKPSVADKVKVLCESFMLSVITIKTLFSNVP